MSDLTEKAAVIQDILYEILQDNEEGFSEYELIHMIKEDVFDEKTNALFNDTQQLFTVHFLIFHALYRLREQLWTSRMGHIEISPLNICIKPYPESGDQGMGPVDKLGEYYLNLSNLKTTSRQDLDDLLDNFWQYFLRPEKKLSAMEILEIKEPFDNQQLKQQYKKMVMLHHPDRGGDKTRLQEINHAFEILKQCL